MSRKKIKKDVNYPQGDVDNNSDNEINEKPFYSEQDSHLSSNQELERNYFGDSNYNPTLGTNIQNQDPNNKKFICAGCNKSYQSYPALYLHQKNKHKGQQIEKIYPANKGRGRTGRPKRLDKTQQQNIEDESQEQIKELFNDENEDLHIDEDEADSLDPFLFFLTTMKINLKTNVNKKDVNAIKAAFNSLPEELQKKSQTLIAQTYNFLTKTDEKLNEFFQQENENNHQNTTCNEIFAIFINELSKFIAPENLKEIFYFICCYHVALNENGWRYYNQSQQREQEQGIYQTGENENQNYNNEEQKFNNNYNNNYNNNQNHNIEQQDDNNNIEFCETTNIETAIDMSNDFTIDIFPNYFNLYKIKDKKFRLLKNKESKDSDTFEKNVEQLTKQFCNWLYLKKYTNSQLNSTFS